MKDRTKIRNWLTQGLLGLAALGILLLILALLAHYLRQAEGGGQTESRRQSEKPEQKHACLDTADGAGAGLGGKSEAEEFLFWKDTSQLQIRVALCGDDYEGRYHQEICITSESDFVAKIIEEQTPSEKEETSYAAGEQLQICTETLLPGQVCIVTPAEGETLLLPDLRRAQTSPAYAGRLLLYRESEGLLLVNELPLEAYLNGVVGSEMPSDYPLEARKAQAVCARTYAYRSMERQKNTDVPADLDDSTSFQVYNNQRASDASAEAVRLTEGELLPLEEPLYYSTAFVPGEDSVSENLQREKTGAVSDSDLSQEAAFLKALQSEPASDAEYGSPWVRWSVRLQPEALFAHLQNTVSLSGTELTGLAVTKRSETGQALELWICSDTEEKIISGEYEIRQALALPEMKVILQDERCVSGMTLLPSAWFCILGKEVLQRRLSEEELSSETPDEGAAQAAPEILLYGGGYGHGFGMSQCGAAAMAAAGADYQEILARYYQESE